MDEALDSPLSDRFELARRLQAQMEENELSPDRKKYTEMQTRALKLLASVLLNLEQLGVLTEHNRLDWVTEGSLKFLATDFYIAQLLDQSYINPEHGAVAGRVRVAKAAIRKYYDFLEVLESHRALDKSTSEAYPVAKMLPNGRYGRSNMPEYLQRIAKGESVSSSLPVRQNQPTQGDLDTESSAQELELRGLQQVAVQALRSCWREVELILQMMPKPLRETLINEPEEAYMPGLLLSAQSVGRGVQDGTGDPRMNTGSAGHMDFAAEALSGELTFAQIREQAGQRDYSTRVESMPEMMAQLGQGPIIGAGGQILRPFVLTNDRQNVAQQIFGTGQVLPTMTLEQAAEYEMQNRVASPPPAQEENQDSEAYVDQQTMKARRWDDYTEANPRGSGNTMNRG